LPYASLSPIPTGKFSIIWGGSTSACCNAIELAVASSSEVNTTSSPRNFGLCKSLGASYTFDYNSKTVVPDMVGALEGEVLYGAIIMGIGDAEACCNVMSKVQCDRKFVSIVSYPLPSPQPRQFEILQTVVYFISWNVR
jgi:hypothetical protein